mmetsp:Transcript_2441/g.3090  ORF Transcript_2441/g.3090 Transcript_2441/m.3090 type:complete len:260 (+) Transcript_2441:154-933(+)
MGTRGGGRRAPSCSRPSALPNFSSERFKRGHRASHFNKLTRNEATLLRRRRPSPRPSRGCPGCPDLRDFFVGDGHRGGALVIALFQVVVKVLLAHRLEFAFQVSELVVGYDVLNCAVVIADAGVVVTPRDAAMLEVGLLGRLERLELLIGNDVGRCVGKVVRVDVVLQPLLARILGLCLLVLVDHRHLVLADGVLLGDGILALLELLLKVVPALLVEGLVQRLLLLPRDAQGLSLVVIGHLRVVINPLLAVGLSLRLYL